MLNRFHPIITSPKVRGALALALVAVAVTLMMVSVHDWPAALDRIKETPPGALLTALLLLLIAGLLAMRSWVAILPRVANNTWPWAQVFFVGQLGKYMPGSVWAAVIQAQLARRLGAKPQQLFGGFVLAFGISVLSAGIVSFPASHMYWGVPVALVLLTGAVLGLGAIAFIVKAPQVFRLTSIDAKASNVVRSAGWSLVGWTISGLHLAVLCIAFGAPPVQAILIATAASALAVGVGSLMIFAPGGIGIRELILLHCLSTIVTPPTAAAIVVLSRVLYLIADVLFALSTFTISLRRKVVT